MQKKQKSEKAKIASKRAEERLKKFNEGGFANTMNYYLGEIGDVLAENLIATIVTVSLGAVGMIYYCCIAGDDDDEIQYTPTEEGDYDIVDDEEEDDADKKKEEEEKDVGKVESKGEEKVEGDAKTATPVSPKKNKRKRRRKPVKTIIKFC